MLKVLTEKTRLDAWDGFLALDDEYTAMYEGLLGVWDELDAEEAEILGMMKEEIYEYKCSGIDETSEKEMYRIYNRTSQIFSEMKNEVSVAIDNLENVYNTFEWILLK